MTLTQLLAVARLSARFGECATATAATVVMAVALIGVPWLRLPLFVVAVAAASAGHGTLTATTASLVSKAGPASHVGARMGANQAAAAIGRVTGPAVGGLLYDVWLAAPYVAGAALLALATTSTTIGWSITRRHATPSTPFTLPGRDRADVSG